MGNTQNTKWHFQIQPFEGESFSHFLGRYCSTNCIAPNTLAKHINVGSAAIGRWRKLRYNPFPTEEHLHRLAEVTGVSQQKLLETLPQEPMQIGTIRLCATCYAEKPYHYIYWQYKSTQYCKQHGLSLLARCPKCKAPFPIPAEWNADICLRCGTAFADMARFQKQIVEE